MQYSGKVQHSYTLLSPVEVNQPSFQLLGTTFWQIQFFHILTIIVKVTGSEIFVEACILKAINPL